MVGKDRFPHRSRVFLVIIGAMIIGRKEELKLFGELMNSGKSEFVAVYGRRRVGKTFLIREAFNYQFAFQHTGILNAPLLEQLREFRESLYSAGMKRMATPRTWSEAFHALERFLQQLPEGRKVLFIDELPWMDTPRSNFIRALDHFWNSWASARRDILLIVCGSATSWIIEHIVMNYGGLHNRLTRQIYLRPFCLRECEELCSSEKLGFTRRQVLEAYMALGGIPYYWSYMRRGESLAQNFDRMFFSDRGELTGEFEALYASLFRNPHPHLAIIHALAGKKAGMSRAEILNALGVDDNITFTKAMRELEQCDFIRRFTVIGKRSKGAMYQLIDNFTLFYYQFMRENVNGDEHFWTNHYQASTHHVWAGLAFERACLLHLPQIKKALGFSAVISSAHAWSCKPADGHGVQIDLLIDRNDDVINLCEMKYSTTKYRLDEQEYLRIQYSRETFIAESGTSKAVQLTLVTPFGLVPGGYANDIPCQVTMDDLFL